MKLVLTLLCCAMLALAFAVLRPDKSPAAAGSAVISEALEDTMDSHGITVTATDSGIAGFKSVSYAPSEEPAAAPP